MIENFAFKEVTYGIKQITYDKKEITYDIIRLCMDVHRQLGNGFMEIVYKDAIEWELRNKTIEYERAKEFSILYKKIILPHKFYVDFILFGNIILEVKASENGISNDFAAHVLNYLKASGSNIGLIVNFGRSNLEFRRVIY